MLFDELLERLNDIDGFCLVDWPGEEELILAGDIDDLLDSPVGRSDRFSRVGIEERGEGLRCKADAQGFRLGLSWFASQLLLRRLDDKIRIGGVNKSLSDLLQGRTA